MTHTSAREPLIWATKHAVFALDPDSGALRWRSNTPVRRLFRLGERLFVLGQEGVSSIDVSSGRALGEISLGFVPSAGVVTPEHLFVAGPGGAAALSPTGTVLWSIKHEVSEGTKVRQFFACQGPDGFQLWREEVTGSEDEHEPTLVYGDQIA